MWVYFGAFYAVPLICISVGFFFFFFFVLVPYCFDDCSFVLKSEVRPLFLMYKWNVFILNETVLTVFSIWQLEFIIRNNVF